MYLFRSITLNMPLKINVPSFSYLLLPLALVFAGIYLTLIRVNTPISMMGDTGLLYSLVQSVHDGYAAKIPLFASISDLLFEKNLMNMSVGDVCNIGVKTVNYTPDQANFFNYHLYLALYPISTLLYLFDAPYVVQGLNIFSFLGFAYICYLLIKRNTNSIHLALLGTVLISTHPAWSLSITGQPYIDRLFLPLGLLLFYFTESKNFFAIVVTGALACLINEKVPVYVGAFLILHSCLFYKKEEKLYHAKKTILGLLILIASYCLIKFTLNNPYYSNSLPHTLSGMMDYLNNERNLSGIRSLLAISSPFLVASLVSNWRYAFLAFMLLMPNIFGDIGGAEKTNFYTHYHTLYFPFLAYGFIQGYSKLYLLLKLVRLKNLIIYSLSIFIIFLYTRFSIDSNQDIHIQSFKAQNNYIRAFGDMKKNHQSNRSIQKLLNSNLLPSQKISSIEGGMPYLYKYRNLSYYPLNLENSDAVVLYKSEIENKSLFRGYSSYQGEDHQLKTDLCLNDRLREFGFDLSNPVYFSNSQFALIKKIRASSAP